MYNVHLSPNRFDGISEQFVFGSDLRHMDIKNVGFWLCNR